MSTLVRRRPRPVPLRTTTAARVAAVLSLFYGIAAAALGVWLIVALATGGSLGADIHDRLVFRGVATAIVYSLMAGVILIAEAFLIVRGARGLGVIILAGFVTIGGLAGEVIEAVMGGDVSSLLTGAGIIVAMALPAILLLLPRPHRSTPPVAAEPPAAVTPPPRP